MTTLLFIANIIFFIVSAGIAFVAWEKDKFVGGVNAATALLNLIAVCIYIALHL